MDLFEAFYFGVITSTTVGYGDHHAQNQHDRKIFISLTVLFGVAAWANLASGISAFVAAKRGEADDRKRFEAAKKKIKETVQKGLE